MSGHDADPSHGHERSYRVQAKAKPVPYLDIDILTDHVAPPGLACRPPAGTSAHAACSLLPRYRPRGSLKEGIIYRLKRLWTGPSYEDLNVDSSGQHRLKSEGCTRVTNLGIAGVSARSEDADGCSAQTRVQQEPAANFRSELEVEDGGSVLLLTLHSGLSTLA